jgi:hypothetical protein
VWAGEAAWARPQQPAGLDGGLGRIGFRNWVLGFEKDSIQNRIQTLNLNCSNQKKCSSMDATINSYISLILF